jgi:hypothetical protein
VKFVTNKDGKFVCFTMTEDEYRELVDDYSGLCVRCGEVTDGDCEPDTRGRTCEACGERGVYGLEELLVLMRIRIVGGEDECATDGDEEM